MPDNTTEMKTIEIGGQQYPVLFNYLTMDSYSKLIDEFGFSEPFERAVCISYSAFVAGKWKHGGDFRINFDDFYAHCLIDSNILEQVGEHMQDMPTTVCNLAANWFRNRNHVLN